MPSKTATILKHVRKLARDVGPDLADRELLGRFSRQQDQDAFAALVWRHGPMVLGVCRRLLAHTHDAEDAYQATFLVLARKAASLCCHDSVAGWLHQVAHHMALKVRAAARRPVPESQTPERRPADPLAEVTVREAQAIFHEELARLGEKFRAPLVLCYLEGATRDEAAKQLGLSLATLDRRLHRGRELLRACFARRGLTLSGTLLAAHLGQSASAGVVAPALFRATVSAATQFAAGQTVGSLLTARALTLAQGALRWTFLTRLEITALVVLTLGLAGIGAVVLAQHAPRKGLGPPLVALHPEPAAITQPPLLGHGSDPGGLAKATSNVGQKMPLEEEQPGHLVPAEMIKGNGPGLPSLGDKAQVSKNNSARCCCK